MDEEIQLPSLDDDGFESLDGNGSSDSKEEQDISLTPAEFETVIKNNSTTCDTSGNGLVLLKCCPKFSRQNGNVPNSNDDCGDRHSFSAEDSFKVSVIDDKKVESADSEDDELEDTSNLGKYHLCLRNWFFESGMCELSRVQKFSNSQVQNSL